MKLDLNFEKKPRETLPKKPRAKRHNFTKKQNKRRYYLHYKLRKMSNIQIIVKQLQVNVPHDFDAESNVKIKELCEQFHYNIQYIIL
ncbi:hypothetical protein [Capnocytophaga stomatis]|uniref:hypothetical protein n=1 Tax=Capnocytophaga stomatis TaxID=1848904 RepID=UPI001AC219D3|nr:hypothetical protein [Capnocytophaga stomatis]GIM49440.1 hypothetical protein CAPN003_08920 [Capnocytophaga stomatis]